MKLADDTYLKLSNYGIYLCAILDLYSRRVVGYRVSQKASTNLVTATFRAAFEDRGKPQNLTFHSDRGGQYVSATFVTLLQKSGVKQSFFAPGHPHDNAAAESFLQTSKKKKPTAETIPLSKASQKVWRSIFSFITRYGPIKRLRKRHKTILRNYITKTDNLHFCEEAVFK